VKRLVLLLVIAGVLLGQGSALRARATGDDPGPVYLSQNAVTTDFNGREDNMGGLAVQPDGKIVAAGAATGADGIQRFGVARYLPTGTLDPTFGDGGRVSTLIGTISSSATAVALQSDGRIVVGGYASDPDGYVSHGLRFALARYLPDGRLDPEFHHPEPWTALTDGGRPGMIRAIAIQPDDKIVVTGDDVRTSAIVARYLPDGRTDPSFASQGTFAAVARSVLVQPDGRIITGGSVDDMTGDAVINRFEPNAARDGILPHPKSLDFASPDALALQPDGALVAGGETHCGISYCFGLVRYRADGNLDTGFGRGGVASTPIGTQAFVRAVIVQPDGKILAIGAGMPDRDLDFVVARYQADGTLDSSFGAGGLAITHITSQGDLPVGAVISGRNLIVGGDAGYGGPTRSTRGSDFALTGTLLPGVSAPAATTGSPEPGSDPVRPPGPGPGANVASAAGAGYWALAADGHVYPFGAATAFGNGTSGAVDLEPNPAGTGYWILNGAGAVQAFGQARDLGGINAKSLTKNEKPASLSALPNGRGYWIFTTRGRVFTFGEAPQLGDMSRTTIMSPVLDSVATPSGKGYYMVASDGGIFAFGDARFTGSMGGQKLNAAVQSLVPDADSSGYWLVASDGGIFAFDAPFRGSMGGTKLNKPVVGMVRYGDGYLMVGADGGIFNFSSSAFAGSLGDKTPTSPIVAVAALT
jgi:uncharacterized delta-60 repeat protein